MINPPLAANLSTIARSASISSLSIQDCSLLTDLYQLTMTACYVGESLDRSTASFELFIRKLPKGFGYLIAMGLAQALEYLEQLPLKSPNSKLQVFLKTPLTDFGSYLPPLDLLVMSGRYPKELPSSPTSRLYG
jgi:nicotinic acid phosphoribosyltransferase